MKHDNNLIWFDFLRGIAALLVLTSHLRALIFDDFSKTNNLFCKFFYFITGFGHQAVVIFFVLSGFFIIRSIHESVLINRWSIKEYIINRIVRLWVVLLPSLFLTLLWDKLGLLFFKDSFTYSGLITTMTAINPENKLGLINFIGNLFFLQTIKVPTFGSNGALWSLANEFWYYFLFPMIYFSFSRKQNIYKRITLITIILAFSFFIGYGIILYFIVWLMGGFSYIIIKNNSYLKNNLTIKIIALLLIFFTTMFCIRSNIYPNIFNDFSLGLITSFMLCVFYYIPMKNLYLRNVSKYLSNISYTVYLTHLSFAVLFVSILFNHRVSLNYSTFIYYILILTIIILYCYVIYFLFEKNTKIVKDFVTNKKLTSK